MEVNFGVNSVNNNNTQSTFDNVLSAVAGNQFFDQKALQKIQTDDLREAFNEWVENDFMSENNESGNWLKTTEELEDEAKYAGVSPGMRDFVKSADEYREDWDKFNVAESKRASLRNQIEKTEQQQAFEMSLSEVTGNNKQIAALKAQIQQVQEE
jgi:hypothetical protein